MPPSLAYRFLRHDLVANNRLLWLWLLYGLLTLIGILHHEPWRDEGDSWLVAQDMGFFELVSNHTTLIGHPALWYLILMPFAKAGFPYITMHIIHWCIATGVAWFVLFRLPLPLIVRALIVFSLPFSYEYAVIARNYSIAVLLLFVALTYFTRRHLYPVRYALSLALLPQAHVLAIGPAIGLLAIDALAILKNRRILGWQWLLFGFFGISGLCLLYQFWPHPERPCYRMPICSEKFFFLAHISNTLKTFGSISRSITLVEALHFPDISNLFIRFTLIAAEPLLAIVILKECCRGREARVFIVISLLWLLFVFLAVYTPSYRHAVFIFIVLVGGLWLLYTSPQSIPDTSPAHRRLYLPLYILLGINLVSSVTAHTTEIQKPYSGGKEMARFLIEKGYIDRPVMIYQRATGAILPYLREENPNKRFYHPCTDFFSYGHFTQNFVDCYKMTHTEALYRSRDFFQQHPDALIILSFTSSQDVDDAHTYGTILYTADGGGNHQESFHLIKPGNDFLDRVFAKY